MARVGTNWSPPHHGHARREDWASDDTDGQKGPEKIRVLGATQAPGSRNGNGGGGDDVAGATSYQRIRSVERKVPADTPSRGVAPAAAVDGAHAHDDDHNHAVHLPGEANLRKDRALRMVRARPAPARMPPHPKIHTPGARRARARARSGN